MTWTRVEGHDVVAPDERLSWLVPGHDRKSAAELTGDIGNIAVDIGNNRVAAVTGPLAVAGAIGVSDHNGVGTNPPAIIQTGTGFNVKTPLNP